MQNTEQYVRSLPAGPRWPGPLQIGAYGVRPAELFDHCARRYGDAFTLHLMGGAPTVHFCAPDAVRTVLELPATDFTVTNDVLEPILGTRSLLMMDGDVHKRERRMMLRAFHVESFAVHEQTIETIARDHLARWPRNEPIPMLRAMQSLTLDVMLRVLFGVEDEARARVVLPALDDFLQFADSYWSLLAVATRGRLFQGRWDDFVARRDRVLAQLVELIDERRRDPNLETRVDVLSMLLRAHDDQGQGFDDDALRDELMTLLLAGHDTTATSLAWATDLLAHDRRVASKLAGEVAQGGDSYVDAVVKEVTRIRPVVPEAGRLLAVDTTIGEWRLPAGTDVVANVYLAHRRPQEYPEPDAFVPERFVDGAPPLHAWHPFGGGVRRCLGIAFATLELRTVLRVLAESVSLTPVRAPNVVAAARSRSCLGTVHP